MNIDTIEAVLRSANLRPLPSKGHVKSAVMTLDDFTVMLSARHVAGKEYFLTVEHKGHYKLIRVYSESRDGTTRGDSRVKDLFERRAAHVIPGYQRPA